MHPPIHMEKPLRVCRVCGLEAYTEENLDLFVKLRVKKGRHGRGPLCKKCANAYGRKWANANREKTREKARKYNAANREKRKEYNRKWHEANREKLKEYERRRHAANPFSRTQQMMKTRSKRKGLDFNLDKEYIEQLWDDCKGICSMTGVSMKKNSTVNDPFVMSVDRINSKKGYTKDNVRLVSRWYNVSRNNYGDKLTIEMCHRVVKHIKQKEMM